MTKNDWAALVPSVKAAVDAAGQWQDPTICKISSIDLLRAEDLALSLFENPVRKVPHP